MKYLKFYAILFILLGGGAGGYFLLSGNFIPQERRLSAETVIEKITGEEKNDYLLIDVREPWENQAIRIPGSKLIPLKIIESEPYEEIQKLNKNQKLILYCTVGVRSDKAYGIFTKLGFDQVYVMNGGLDAWMEEQGPLETPSIPQWIEGKGCES
ncbi:MAG: rhodanese-like domain-containing protein [SAR324 cluster bacterium]|nr:rhodanese-like domain-containing protein [SAR324 cluster bacterium]MBL7034308.1 rhodanese-like domain-containing protein [SAR324 cluster bacterium]